MNKIEIQLFNEFKQEDIIHSYPKFFTKLSQYVAEIWSASWWCIFALIYKKKIIQI